MDIVDLILLPWWFALPGYVGNICPGFARKLPCGTIPVSIQYLGPNKTWMAVPASIFGATLSAFFQSFITYTSTYPSLNWPEIAICFGLGVPLGDWTKSFFKRRLGIIPGGKWWIEKIDFLLASFLLLTLLGGVLPISYYIVPIGFYLLVHGPGNRLSYRLGWRNTPH